MVWTEATPVAFGSVLDLAPEFGAGIPTAQWRAARQACRGELVSVPSGRWEPASTDRSRAGLGLLIASGMICREVGLRDRHLIELLGPGDVLQLPVQVPDGTLGTDPVLTAAVPTELLALGAPFIRAAGRWPGVLIGLHQRLEGQHARLRIQALITHLPLAEQRVLLMLWHMADRWGVVTRDGIVVQLPLSHDLLGDLTAARRPTTSLAIAKLQRTGELKRLPDRSWLLTPAGERAVETIAATHNLARRSRGEVFALRMRSSHATEDAKALRAEAGQMRAHGAGLSRRVRTPASD
jgi:CRP-like cAMP-binding protein